ncbi:MAG: hypothetical protein WCF90_11245, partial [Methanomicrobiales archaeon]
IRADQQYFSSHVSSANVVRLDITTLSGRERGETLQTWSASYGYVIRVTPATSEVIILGNPVTGDNNRDIFWTWSGTDPGLAVRINLHLFWPPGGKEIKNSSILLTGCNNDILYVDSSFIPTS